MKQGLRPGDWVHFSPRKGSLSPENYSQEAFKEKRLDYGLHLYPVELWGSREHVMKTVAVHNEIISRLAAQHKAVLFVDQANLLAGSPRYFNDACHFTVVGSLKFVENLMRVLLPSEQDSVLDPLARTSAMRLAHGGPKNLARSLS